MSTFPSMIFHGKRIHILYGNLKYSSLNKMTNIKLKFSMSFSSGQKEEKKIVKILS